MTSRKHESGCDSFGFHDAMTLLSALPILRRTASVRPTLLPLVLARNGSRLSGIHDGLRRSESARPQGRSPGPKREIRQPPTPEPYLSPSDRRAARVLARQNPKGYKIKKGKKDITEPAGPGRLNTAKRYSDPRDPLGAGSLLKKFKTGKLLGELRKGNESKGGPIQPEDFARQMLAGDVENLMNSRKFPERTGRAKTKSHYTKLGEARAPSRESRAGSFDRPAHGGFTRDAYQDRDRRDREDNTFGRERRDRETSRETYIFTRDTQIKDAPRIAGRSDRSDHRGADKEVSHGSTALDHERPSRAHRDANNPREDDRNKSDRRGPDKDLKYGSSGHGSSSRDHHDRVTPREGGRSDTSDRQGPNRAFRHGGVGYDRPDRDQRGSDKSETSARDQRTDTMSSVEPRSTYKVEEASPSREGTASGAVESKPTEAQTRSKWEGGVEQDERRKNKYEPPVSIPYTTAASQFLYGTSTVEAALATSRRKLYKLYIYQGGNRMRQEKDDYLANLASEKGVPVEWVDEQKLPMLNKMSTSRPHNGHVLEASPLPQLPVTALGEVLNDSFLTGFKVLRGHQSTEDAAINGTSEVIVTEPNTHKPFVLFLDEIVDPQNLGAIIRTATFMGVSAVVTSKRGSASVTPVVLKASSGAAETMTMLSVDSPVDFVSQSKSNGWRVYAGVPPKADASRHQVDMRAIEKDDPLRENPCILVMGSEGEGLSRQLRRSAHSEVSIPNMSGSKALDSLNVSVAAGLLCSAFVRGRSMAQNSGAADRKAMF